MSLLMIRGLRLLTVANNVMKPRGYPVRQRITDLTRYGIEWVRPERVSSISAKKSGDGGINFHIKPTDIPSIYTELPEFKDIDDKFKSLLSVAYMTEREFATYKMEKTKDLVRRHKCDKSSYESNIAAMTAMILRLQEHIKHHPKNAITKIFLKELIEKRHKHLRHLRNWDYRKFEWLLEKLNLTYHPLPTDRTPPYRKNAIRRLVQKKCDTIVQTKLMAYKEKLNEEKKKFLVEKVEKLAFIRAEEIACGVKPTVTEEDIEKAKRDVL